MKTLCALVAATTLVFSSCARNDAEKQKDEYLTISGIPMGLGESYARTSGSLAVVLKVPNQSQPVLAYTYISLDCRTSAEAQALIQSEINDGDEEEIELFGKYDGKKFQIKRLKANGLEVDF